MQTPLTNQTLRRIFQTGAAIKDLCPVPYSQPPHDTTQTRIVLPAAPSIRAQLLRLNLDLHIVEDLVTRYSEKSEQLRSAAQDSLHRACLDLARVPRHSALIPLPKLLDGVIAAYTANYTKALDMLERRAIAIASRPQPAAGARRPKVRGSIDRKPFNHEFTPFLQKYFEYNAFPSAADRVAMAKKSMMEPRQIEVWFQNHRRRAKSEGKAVRKLGPADPPPLELCLQSLEEKMEPYLIPEPLRQSVDSDVSEAGSDDEEEDEFDDEKRSEDVDISDVLNPPAARHAFPMPYARGRHMVSAILPTQEFSFPPPVWQRKAAVTPVNRPVVTIDECVSAFARFHVYDPTRVLSPPFRIATTVIPPSAPLPALVRGKFTPSPVDATTALNIIPAPRSRQHPFRSPSPFSQPATLSPRRKKVAGPPRRTPKRVSRNHRGASPATSDTSTLRSSSETSTMRSASPPSRTPSLESIGFSPSRTPSFGSTDSFSSSRSSSSSSGPATPTGSPAALPLEIPADMSYLDVFGDYARLQQYVSSPVEADGKQRRQAYPFGFEGYAR
ncbi:hypothetical protein FB451DRAFT_1078497 [Mycena latifolia]|nr:hypothetical protein FB451DRAFT_1078497 [Mycena latifolia]